MADNRFQVTGLVIDAQLPFGAGSFAEDRVYVVDGAATSQVVDHVIHKLQELRNQRLHWHFGLFSEIDQLPFDAVTRRAPFVFFDQRTTINSPALIRGVKSMQ